MNKLLTCVLIALALTVCVAACSRSEWLWHNRVDENKQPARECYIYADELEESE